MRYLDGYEVEDYDPKRHTPAQKTDLNRQIREARSLQRLREFYTGTATTTSFKHWLVQPGGPSQHDRTAPDYVHTKATWFLQTSAWYVNLFRQYFQTQNRKPRPSYVYEMNKWRLSYHDVPTIFSWIYAEGQTPEFKDWMNKNQLEDKIGMNGLKSFFSSSGTFYDSQRWMKPGTEADLLQTYYYLDQLMQDYYSGTLDPTQPTWEEVGDSSSLAARREGKETWMPVDVPFRSGWALKKSYDLTETYKRLHPDWKNTLDVHTYNPRVLASQTHRPEGLWISGRKRWNPPKGNRTDQKWGDDGVPIVEQEPQKESWWKATFGESGGAPDACTGNPYHVPLD